MTTYNEPARALDFLISEANGQRSRDQGTLAASQGDLVPGTVLGKITVGVSAEAVAFAGNVGNGAMGAITVGAGAKAGVHKLTIIEPTADAGTFQVEDPDGVVIGTGNVAAAFSGGGLGFTLADGSTNFSAGDGFNITVEAGSGEYAAFDPDATDGSQVAAAILCYAADDSTSTQAVALITSDAEVQSELLDWGDADADEITAGTADLLAKGIKLRAA